MQTIRSDRPAKPVARISAVKFQRQLGEARHRARREPVEITRHGRREFVLMSTDHYDGLVAAARRASAVAVLPQALADRERLP